MADKYLKKDRTVPQPTDAFDAFRSLHFKADTRTNAEKVQDSVVEAGHETRSVNQVVKMVNLSLSEKVKRLEKLKEDSKRFEDELNLFMGSPSAQQNTIPQVPSAPTVPTAQTISTNTQASPQASPNPNSTDIYMISRDLMTLINKYGLQKFSTALNGVLLEFNAKENKPQ